MPASRSIKSKAKRPRIPSEDRTDGPEKRPRNGGESPFASSSNINILRDRTRISWQNKGKWRERTPKRTPMSLDQAIDDIFAASTSKRGAEVNAALSPTQLDTSTVEIASTIYGSSPVSPKDVPIPETPIINPKEQELQEEIERLRSQLEQKDQAITQHENTIETVRSCVFCPICLDPLWKPLVVVPCGHMACQGCLISWFTSPPPGHADEPDQPIRRKRKTCPHCRGAVSTKPIEVYGLGGAVAALHPHPAEPPTDTDAPIDPWADIFRPPPVGRAVRDQEDGGIRRCPGCFYEIFDGECAGCGRAFSEGSEDTIFGSDDGSVSVFDDDRGSIYGGSVYGHALFGDERSDEGSDESVYEAEIPAFDYPPRARVYESYDEDEDEDDSFIDGTSLPRPPPAAYFNHYAVSDSEDEPEDGGYHSARGYRSSPIPIMRADSYSCSSSSSGLSDDDDEEEEDDFLLSRGRRGRSVETENLPETAEEADDEDDDEDEASVNPNLTVDLVSDDEDDEPPVRSMGRRSAAERWGGWSRDDGEPPRGRSLSRRRVMSPEDGSEDGSEYFSD